MAIALLLQNKLTVTDWLIHNFPAQEYNTSGQGKPRMAQKAGFYNLNCDSHTCREKMNNSNKKYWSYFSRGFIQKTLSLL